MATAPASTTATSAADSTLITEIINRLTAKQSVDSLLVLSRADGSIIQASGSITLTPPAPTSEDEEPEDTVQHYATVVYQYVKAAEEAVKGLEEIEKKSRPEGTEEVGDDDDVRLLRLRTKKREIVVVPHTKFIMVVFHDSPSAL